MKTDFIVEALDYSLFKKFFTKNNKELSEHFAKLIIADSNPGFPCRVSLIDAHVGETILTAYYRHQNVNSPYRSSGPIFIRENAEVATPNKNKVPEMLKIRPQSIRAYDSNGEMIDASIENGDEIEKRIKQFFENESVDYLHIHNAKQGCYNCKVIRVT